MQVSEFLVVASLCTFIFYRSALGQISEVISRNSALAQDGKVRVNFGDVVIEITHPQGREHIVNTRPNYEKYQSDDDGTYWNTIYGSMDDIPTFEDLPGISGETVNLKYVNEWEEDSNEKPLEISSQDQFEMSIKKSLDMGDHTRTSRTKPLTTSRNSYLDLCGKINPLYPFQQSLSRQKREMSDSNKMEAETKEISKTESNVKRKGRTLSLLQNELQKPRYKSNLRSHNLWNKYRRKFFRPHKHGRGFSTINDCTGHGITAQARSEKFVDSAISAVESVNLGIAKTNQAVTGKIVNAVRQLAQAKHDVIDLGHQATQAIALRSLNNAATNCPAERVSAAVATNVDSGLEVVGNSVLDTNSGIINADTGISVRISSSLDTKTNVGDDTVVGSVVDNDAAVATKIISDAVPESNLKVAVHQAVQKEIAAAENKQEIDLQESKVEDKTLAIEKIIEDTKVVKNPILESDVVKTSPVDDSEKIVGSVLQVNAKSKVHTLLNAGISSDLKTDINIGKNHKDDHARWVLGSQDLSCECTTALDDGYDQEFDFGRRYHDEFQDEQECRRRFRDRSRSRSYSRNYYNRHESGIHTDAGIRSSLDTGIGVNSKLGSISTGTTASLDLNSNVDIGRSTSLGIRTKSNYRDYDYDRDRLRYDASFDSAEDISDYDSIEYREYRPTFEGKRARSSDSINSGIHADAGIHTSLDTGGGIHSKRGSVQTGTAASLDVKSNLDIGSSKNSRIRTGTGIRTSLDTDLDINSDRRTGGLYAGTKSSLDVGSRLDSERTGFRTRKGNGIYIEFDRSIDDCNCDDFEKYSRYHQGFPRDQFCPSHRGLYNSGVHASARTLASLDAGVDVNTDSNTGERSSGLHADSGIHSSIDAEVGLNSDIAVSRLRAGSKDSLDVDSRLDIERTRTKRPDGNYRGYERGEDISFDKREYGHHAGAKSSLDLDSHFDIGTTTLEVNGANSLHLPRTINSAVHADAGIHTSVDTSLGINDGRRLQSELKSSLDLDSHLDIGTRTNGASGVDRRSKIKADVSGLDEKLGEKICETVCQESSDFGKRDGCPNTKFKHTERDRPPYMCDNCRRRMHSGLDTFCPKCGRKDDMFGEQRPFLSSGIIYHLDSPKKNCKRAIDPSEGIEMYPEHAYGYNRYINLDANCSDEAFRHSLHCQGLDDNLQMSRDGNTVPLGFVRTHLSHGHDIALDMHNRARSLAAGGLHPYPHTASMLHCFHSKVSDDLVKLNEESELTLFGTKLLQNKLSVDYNITPNNFLDFLNHHGFRVTGNKICQSRHKRCGGYNKFRSFDGSCNNIAHPTWGQSARAFARILPARYSDGIHGMPVSVTRAELPNPRKLSVRLFSRRSELDPELTLAVMQWGQTLAHDMGRQIMDRTTKGGIECCADNGKRRLPKSLQHHSCAPITISPTDQFYSSHDQHCMNFVRAMTICREDCTLGPADQLNGVTSFVDCSTMYGADKATLAELREFTGGRMKVEFRSGRWMLPTMTNRSSFCDISTADDVCYKTGDPRNNQNPQLVILQTMLVREHNRVAYGLAKLNPDWNDERIFEESRRIVIAEYQHITYNEWLPLLLGERYAKKHGLYRTKPGMSNAYNERVDPTTTIGFTSGAFRSLHSMIEGDIGLCNVKRDVVNRLRLSDHFFRPKVIEKNNNFEQLLRGLTTQRMQMQDMNWHRELTEYLFRSRNTWGIDLAAVDIQRGRDHGVPGYNAYRKICQLDRAEDFDDLWEEISWENIQKLRRNYAHVDDIDLIVGATMEYRAPGSKFGPTNRCLIAEQFYRSRVGDRYFYDNANLSHSFTPEQFHEITKVTLSRLMCDVGDTIVEVQRNAFRAISPKNPLIPCEDLPKLDLTLWME